MVHISNGCFSILCHAGNKGCEGSLPNGWEVITLEDRINKQIDLIDSEDSSLNASLVALENKIPELIGEEKWEAQKDRERILKHRDILIRRRGNELERML